MTRAAIHRELVARGRPARAAVARRYFKTGPGEYAEGDRFIGVPVPVVRALSRKHADLPLRRVATLLESAWHEERLLALFILIRRYQRAGPADRSKIHRLYLRHTRWINNWDLVDCSAEFIVGAHLPKGRRRLLLEMAASRSVWERRIAVLATFHYIKAGEFTDAFRVIRSVLTDPHDLIHKAAGWMLREIGKRDGAAEERFLRDHASRMPRTMLRYAVEKLPASRRRQYLALGDRRFA